MGATVDRRAAEEQAEAGEKESSTATTSDPARKLHSKKRMISKQRRRPRVEMQLGKKENTSRKNYDPNAPRKLHVEPQTENLGMRGH